MDTEGRFALVGQLKVHEREVIFFYRLATVLFVCCLLAHLLFSSYLFVNLDTANNARVYMFALLNLTALVIELYLMRVAFMLGSRAGQLRDIGYAIQIAESQIDSSRFEAACRAIMAMRRDTVGLKILDIEAIAAKLSGLKLDK